jgi:glutamyl-Q tRNA(Asp) synthetase
VPPLPNAPRLTRYAPSPTGYLHLGHVGHMLYVWGAARAFGAEVLLRIEDHDRGRCRPEYERAIVEDLAWLGFEPSNRVDSPSQWRQSDCDPAYWEALGSLRERAHVYRCGCTRRELAARCPAGPDGERRYDGFCRARNVPEREPHGLRVVLEPGEESFVDVLLAEQRQDPAEQCGDLLVRGRDGDWTYQFAVVADDLRHGVGLVVRGEDLLASTGRQIRLTRLLGATEQPVSLHHPLILDASGEKLGKRTGAPPVRDRRMAGETRESILGEAAWRGGIVSGRRETSLEALLDDAAELVLRRAAGSFGGQLRTMRPQPLPKR